MSRSSVRELFFTTKNSDEYDGIVATVLQVKLSEEKYQTNKFYV